MKEAQRMSKVPQVVLDAEAIANAAFGDDYTKQIARLDQEKGHVLGCGCRSCWGEYKQHLKQTVTVFFSQDPRDK